MASEITSLDFDTGKELSVGQEQLISSSGLTSAFQVARKEYFDALVRERPDYDASQLAYMERASYQFARIKQKEATGNYSSEQNYTMANRTFLDTLNALHKLDLDIEDRDKFKRDFMSMMAEAIKYSIKDLDEETQKNVMFLLSKKYEEISNG